MHVTSSDGKDHSHDHLVGGSGSLIQVAEAAPLPSFHIIVDDRGRRKILKVLLVMFGEGEGVGTGDLVNAQWWV
jgi:hypothetical protein